MDLLNWSCVEQWKRGNQYYTPLEPHIQGSNEKLVKSIEHFLEWVRERGLQPVEASYVRTGIHGVEQLPITVSGDEEDEKFYRTHYAHGDLSPRKSERLKEKLNKTPDIVVFQSTGKASPCSECGETIEVGDLLQLEKQQPVCMTCADLDHLEFLPAGDATLSRRARKNSPLSAVVVRFSRSRKRYERQGILVTADAIEQAEASCEADADERSARREKDVERRQREDRELCDDMTTQILDLFPSCPPNEAREIAAHTARRGSGRVGRSAAGRALDPRAIELAVIAWIRHQHTPYDELLMRGEERHAARDRIRAEVDQWLQRWVESDE
jgi:hypothetical protein